MSNSRKRQCGVLRNMSRNYQKAISTISNIVDILCQSISNDNMLNFSDEYCVITIKEVKKVLIAKPIPASLDLTKPVQTSLDSAGVISVVDLSQKHYKKARLVVLQDVDEFKFYISDEPDMLRSDPKLAQTFMKLFVPILLRYSSSSEHNHKYYQECIHSIIDRYTKHLEMDVSSDLITKWCNQLEATFVLIK